MGGEAEPSTRVWVDCQRNKKETRADDSLLIFELQPGEEELARGHGMFRNHSSGELLLFFGVEFSPDVSNCHVRFWLFERINQRLVKWVGRPSVHQPRPFRHDRRGEGSRHLFMDRTLGLRLTSSFVETTTESDS